MVDLRRWQQCALSTLYAAFVVVGVVCGQDDQKAFDSRQAAERAFTIDVLPVLTDKCLGCHGAANSELKGELDLSSRDLMLAGGESGDPSIVPGDAEGSLLFQAINWDGLEMPPKENDRLTAAQISAIKSWIDSGAVWPSIEDQQHYREEARQNRETAEGRLVDTSGGTSADWTYRRYQPDDLWAWQPVPRSSDLYDSRADEGQNPIDYFVAKKLQDAGFAPAPQASPEKLIRRASLDLIGLPPKPQEVTAFLEQWERNPETAWSNLIERLLDSPHYGERWAQHWLDVTRYADTGGMSNDYERSNMWRYRDYVIRSFNNDKPYNQFIVEQLAGDELADASVLKRSGEQAVLQAQLNGRYDAEEAEQIVATGFLRLGPWDNAMIDAAEARQIFLDDVVNVVGQTFLSTTMRCVKCHDHKFDPIPTRDYYRLYAAFSTTHMAERNVPFLKEESLANFEVSKQHVEKMLAFAMQEKERLVNKRESAARAWFEERGLEYKDEQQRKDLPDEEKPPRHVGLDYIEEGQLKVREQDEWIWTRRLERYEPMAQSVYNAGSASLAWNGARKLRIDSKADRSVSPSTTILVGGSLTALGDPVGPGVLSATGLAVHPDAEDPYLLPDTLEGRRLALARWIADDRNPLTTRSIVNRVWQYHFGKGIAANPNNFGAKGARPTHPELLDYLAADFVENGWTLKRIHRLIMNSKTYQQATSHNNASELANVDPGNELLAYYPMRRLTAEELRDSMLSVTGELNTEMGGLPAMPEINMEVALQPRMIQFSIAPAYQPDPSPERRNRRTIYSYRVRGQADPFLELFNQPNPNESCEFRDTAAVTPQAFTMLNSDVISARSIALAQRVEEEAADVPAQIARAFSLVLGRQPSEEEAGRMVRYVSEMTDYHTGVSVAAREYPTEITRSLVEEFSGKPFEYQEILPGFEAYQADASPADVSPATRALADLCLLLFNTNEFMFVR